MSAVVQEIDQLFIGGQWVAPSSNLRIESIAPGTGLPLGSVAAADTQDVDRAVAAARAALDSGEWQRLPPTARAAALAPLADAIKERAEEFATLVSAEVGCAISYSRTRQVPGAAMMVDYFASLAASTAWEERRPGFVKDSIVLREPVGVVAAVVPWNTPLMSVMVKAIPALIAGCAVVVKTPPEIALCSVEIAKMLEACDLPAGLVSLLVADREVSEHLVSHPDVDKVAFTGSTAVGKRILEICARSVRRATMELGGKSSAIVLDDADLETTVAGLVAGGMTINGQQCTAQQRVLLPESRAAEFTEAIVAAVKALKVGDPLDEATEVGPLIAERQRERVEGLLATAREEGATVLAGGGRPAGLDAGWYVEPTVLGNVAPDSTIGQVEVFGPALCLMIYRDEDEAVVIANGTEYGLAGAVWTGDEARGERVARRVRTGMCGVNGLSVDFAAPFGGIGASGLGREMGPEGLEAFVEYKTLTVPKSQA
ncbi:aldehyde dehydrogenase family protein [Georgenia sp. AZ-5]|uniref:aldehyde dehydrogenase family protein n=1 Tax=Georgenia sp. AZ-5 TaxID=3367526 RepID=UPI0037548898